MSASRLSNLQIKINHLLNQLNLFPELIAKKNYHENMIYLSNVIVEFRSQERFPQQDTAKAFIDWVENFYLAYYRQKIPSPSFIYLIKNICQLIVKFYQNELTLPQQALLKNLPTSKPTEVEDEISSSQETEIPEDAEAPTFIQSNLTRTNSVHSTTAISSTSNIYSAFVTAPKAELSQANPSSGEEVRKEKKRRLVKLKFTSKSEPIEATLLAQPSFTKQAEPLCILASYASSTLEDPGSIFHVPRPKK